MKKNIDFIGIYGPTASGKTSLALQLAKKYPVEIISVDSALVYRDMNIGTAKPTTQQLKETPHHLIDIINPDEKFALGEFHQRCSVAIKQINAKGKIPLLVGGTGLYFESIIRGYNNLPVIDPRTVEEGEYYLQEHGHERTLAKLIELDKRHAQIKPADKQRIHRAWCVYRQTQTAIFDFWKDQKPLFNGVTIAIKPDSRDALRDNIKQRMEVMFDEGFINETDSLIKKYQLSAAHNSMRCVGYRQIFQYLSGEISKNEVQNRVFYATCQYAKRQITWLNRMNAPSIKITSQTAVQENVGEIITKYFKQ